MNLHRALGPAGFWAVIAFQAAFLVKVVVLVVLVLL